jgi:signal peptidase II
LDLDNLSDSQENTLNSGDEALEEPERFWSRKNLPNILRDYLFLFVIAAGIVLLDQLTKSAVRASLLIGESWSPWEWLAPYARIVHWHNTGAAFGMLQNLGNVFRNLAVIVAIAIIYFFPQVPREEWPLRIAMGLQLGGALGNFTDRIMRGSVTDFISVGKFPVFNIADSSITIGVAVLIIGMWIRERQQQHDNLEEATNESPEMNAGSERDRGASA